MSNQTSDEPLLIRRAYVSEAADLSRLAYVSKSYWPHDQVYLDAARRHMQITGADIEQDLVNLIED